MICRRGTETGKKNNRIRIALVFLALAALGGSVGYVYAKYFSQSFSDGIAIASGVYFTANYAVEVAEDEEEFFESAVRYTGGNQDISFEVRNYENLLLFNESTVAIPYTISFWLEEESENTSFQVSAEGGIPQLLSTTKTTLSEQVIGGGSALANKYIISVSSEQAQEAPPVFVEVKTAEGAMVKKTLRGKILLNASGTSQVFLEQEFKLPQAEKEEDITAFIYEIRTVGDVATEDIVQQLKLSWNPKLLEIDIFDEAYLTWQEKENPKPLKPYEEDGRYYIIMDSMPYSVQTVTFFRGSEYTDKADLKATNPSRLEENENFVIWAEKYQSAD